MLSKWRGFICLVRGHEREYWSRDKVEAEHVIGGVFTPFKCRRCGYESQVFYFPEMPPNV